MCTQIHPVIVLLLVSFFSLVVVYASPLSRGTGKAALAVTTKVNTAGVGNIAERDRARIRALTYTSLRAAIEPVSVSNAAFFFTVQVGVGTPPANRTLLVDTGSSNTWVGANETYVTTKSSVDTGNSVYVGYGTGAFDGEEWLDNITLAPGLTISQQSIGVALHAQGMHGFDGILGLGPVDLTENTVNNTFLVPTVMDNLHCQGTISQEVLGIFFPPVSAPDDSGVITFGGYDTSATTSEVSYVPLTTINPAARYWGVNQSIAYGNTSILASTAGIVDTGTTLILIPSDAFELYANLTGGTANDTTGLLTISAAQYANLQTLWFDMGTGTPYGLTPNAQIWPRSLNAAIGGRSDAVYLIVGDIGYPSGAGLDFCNGYSFLQRFYSVFDTTQQRFGIAQTAYTNSETN